MFANDCNLTSVFMKNASPTDFQVSERDSLGGVIMGNCDYTIKMQVLRMSLKVK